MKYKFIGVELARTGKFDASTGSVTLTTQDFDDMAEAYKQLKGKVDIPIKLGHDDAQAVLSDSGLPAAGWVENVRRSGDKLVADLINIPEPVYKLMESGALRKRSIEAIRNYTLAGTKWKFALVGLALLGAELPAVDSLEDIAALYASGRVVLASDDSDVVVVQMKEETLPSSDSDPDALIEELRTLISKIAATTAGKRGAPRLRQLLSVTVDELKRTPVRAEHLQEGVVDIDINKLRTKLKLPETATEAEVLAALEAEESTPPPNEAALAAMRTELSQTQAKVVLLESKVASDKVTIEVDTAIKARRFMPAARESLIKLALHDSEAFQDLVKNTPENTVLAPEAGSSGDGNKAEDVSDSELKIAAQMGLTKEDLTKSKERNKVAI